MPGAYGWSMADESADGPSGQPDPTDPFGLGALFGGALGGSGGDIFGQLQRLLSGSGGPVNWELAQQIARAAIASDVAVPEHAQREIADAGRLADLWLDPVTTLPASGLGPQSWTKGQWLDQTLASWKQLVEPVAARVTESMGEAMGTAMGSALGEGPMAGLPPELAGMLSGLGGNPFAGAMEQIGGLVFGAQVGTALGGLAGEVLSTGDIGIPLGPTALVPSNITSWAEGLEVPLDEVRLYLALREAAHERLFSQVPWLRAHLYDAVHAYARGIEVDVSGIDRAMESFDPSNPESMREAVTSDLFRVEPTPAQRAALDRLELALALVEGWVDLVVDQAAASTLPHATQLRETVRRRRASGGPAEQTFATLVGLQLRPRRLREAAALWETLTERLGVEGRDALWAHPDLLPGASDLDDPTAWAGSGAEGATDWDAGLQALDRDLDGELDPEASSPYGLDGEGSDDRPSADGPPDGP
jgi:putative hydrolase